MNKQTNQPINQPTCPITIPPSRGNAH